MSGLARCAALWQAWKGRLSVPCIAPVHVGTAAFVPEVYVLLMQVVARIKAQSQKNVRAMDYDAGRNLLVTAGFDRSVNFFLEHSPVTPLC